MHVKSILLAALAVLQLTSAVAINAPRDAHALAGAEAAATKTKTKSKTKTAASATKSAATYEKILLKQHNLHRANHSAPDVVWNETLADIANIIAQRCSFAHNVTVGGGGYGQNIEAGTAPAEVAAVVTNEWYDNEEPHFLYYGQANPSTNFAAWGHFSQVVWKNTAEIGCATADCTGGLAGVGSGVRPYLTVCNYKPPGNVGGEYAKNIGKPLGHRNIVIDG